MTARTPKETFLILLSHVRAATERGNKIYDELGKAAQDAQVQEALEARAFVAQSVLAKIDQCFKIIGEKPVNLSGRLQDVFLEDFRKEVSEIETPAAKRLFILAKLIQLTHFRIGEYMALVAAADATGHYGVGVLLESCLADKLAFVERTRRLIREVVASRLGERKAAGAEQAA
jgi:ferritin-like metal-binding protein YciE